LFDAQAGTGDPVFTATLGTLEADKQDRQEVIRTYAGADADLTDPLLSPVFAGPELLAGLPPCMLLAADEDLTAMMRLTLARMRPPRVWRSIWWCGRECGMIG